MTADSSSPEQVVPDEPRREGLPAGMETLSLEAELTAEAQVRRRNLIFAWILGILVILLIFFTIFSIYVTGFRPLDDIDLFRSP